MSLRPPQLFIPQTVRHNIKMHKPNKMNIEQGVELAAEKALSFIEKVAAGPLIEGTGIFTDKVKYWRFKNQINIIIKAQKFLKEKGIKTPKKIKIKDLTTLLEYASFEEEEKMQDNWANLLANTLNPDNEFDACNIYSTILNQISMNEINILEYVFSNCFFRTSEDRPYFKKHELIKSSSANYQIGFLLIDNLLRLRLIEEKPPELFDSSRQTKFYNYGETPADNEIIASEMYRLSKFGVELMRQIKK